MVSSDICLFVILNISVSFLIWKAYFSKDKAVQCTLYALSAYTLYIIVSCQRRIELVNGVNYGGFDMNAIRNIYDQYAHKSIEDFFSSDAHEPLFLLVNWIAKHTFNDYRFVLFFFHTIAFVFSIIFIFQIKLKARSLFSFIILSLVIGNLFFMFSMFRNGCAISVASVAYIYAKKKRYVLSLACTLLALSIHNSSVFILFYVLVVFTIDKIQLKNLKQVIVFFVLVILLFGAVVFAAKGIIYSTWAPYYVSFNTSMALRSYMVFLLLGVYGFIAERKSSERDQWFIIDSICVLLSFSIILFDVHWTISYRFVYLVLPIVYSYMAQLSTRFAGDGLRIKKEHFCVELFMILYVLYRVYILYFYEIPGTFPFEICFGS